MSKKWLKLSIKETGHICNKLKTSLSRLRNLRHLNIYIDQVAIENKCEKNLLNSLVSKNRLQSYGVFANTCHSNDLPLTQISKIPKLKSLSLILYNITPVKNRPTIRVPIRCCKDLSKLRLTLHNVQAIDAKVFGFLFFNIVQLPLLEDLTFYVFLESTILKKSTMNACVKLLSRMDQLKKLETSIFFEDEEDNLQLQTLSHIIKELPQLQGLTIKILNNDIIDVKLPSSYPSLISSISKLTDLKSLNLIINSVLEPKESVHYAHTITTIEKTSSFTLIVQPMPETNEIHRRMFTPLTGLTKLENFTWSSSMPVQAGIRSIFE